jgi:hypothetical protein
MPPGVIVYFETVLRNVQSTYAPELIPGTGGVTVIRSYIHVIRQPAGIRGAIAIKVPINRINALHRIRAGFPEVGFIHAVRILNVEVQ